VSQGQFACWPDSRGDVYGPAGTLSFGLVECLGVGLRIFQIIHVAICFKSAFLELISMMGFGY